MFDDNIDERDDKTLQIAKDRDKIKEKMIQNLEALDFNEKEIKSVLDIIFIAEGKIQALKSSLIGTNINTDDPTPAMVTVLSQIKELQIKMAEDIKEKVAQIQKKKSK